MTLATEATKYPGIFRYATKKGSRYLVRFRDARNRSTDKRGFCKIAEARDFQGGLTDLIRTGRYVAPTSGRTTISELNDSLYAAREATWAKTYRATWQSQWRNHIKPAFGHLQVQRLTEARIQDWVNNLAASGLSPRYCRALLTQTKAILNHAVALKATPGNAAADVTPPRKAPRRRRRYLSHIEVHRIAAHLSDFYRAVFIMLVYTGIRWGELAALEVGDIDLKRRRATIRRSASRVHAKGGGWQVGTPKNGEDRTVPLPPHVISALRPFLKGKSPHGLLFPPQGKTAFLELPRTPGKGRRPSQVQNWLWIGCNEAGLDPISPHMLRHTFASLAVQSGASVKLIQLCLGHATAAMTLDIYSDLFDADLDGVSTQMSAAWEAAGREEVDSLLACSAPQLDLAS